jgi:hypothetical protein
MNIYDCLSWSKSKRQIIQCNTKTDFDESIGKSILFRRILEECFEFDQQCILCSDEKKKQNAKGMNQLFQ